MIEAKSLILENTIIIGIICSKKDENNSKDYLDELAFLAHTAGGKVLKRFVQNMQIKNPKTFIGSGKMQEVEKYVREKEVTTVVFDDELTPAQQGNIEKILRCKILDRTGLILDIFAQRAKTSYARTQVELAQYEYLLPRLTRMWTHLERQKGGIGMRGPGETEIETEIDAVEDDGLPSDEESFIAVSADEDETNAPATFEDAGDFINDKLTILFATVSRKLDWGANMISNIETMEITKANFNAD